MEKRNCEKVKKALAQADEISRNKVYERVSGSDLKKINKYIFTIKKVLGFCFDASIKLKLKEEKYSQEVFSCITARYPNVTSKEERLSNFLSIEYILPNSIRYGKKKDLEDLELFTGQLKLKFDLDYCTCGLSS